MPKALVKTAATFFGVGYLPLAPGTFGSIAGFLIFILAGAHPAVYLPITAVVTAAGFLVAGRAEEAFGKKDSPLIVIDEVAGMLLTLLLVPHNVAIAAAGLVLFRIFDIFKPYPANRLQALKGSAGVMIDDIVAALYTNVVLQVFLRLAVFKFS